MINFQSETAQKVLEHISKMVSKEIEKDFVVKMYANGREQGYHIQHYGRKIRGVSFSEYRNTDQIVVYFGLAQNFSANGHVPDAKTYEKKEFFGNNKHKKAAEFIVNFLTSKGK